MIRAALGNVPGVDVLCDQDHSRLQEFPEAKLLWSLEHSDLSANLAEIRLDSSAGHYRRKLDAISNVDGLLGVDEVLFLLHRTTNMKLARRLRTWRDEALAVCR